MPWPCCCSAPFRWLFSISWSACRSGCRSIRKNSPNVEPGLAFGTAASFTTNTNWQAYIGESTMSYLTQMAGLAYHNFVSAAVGIVLAIVVIRGIARKETDKLGNFWVDTHPLSLVGSAATLHRGFLGPGFARRDPEFQALYHRRSVQPYPAQVTGPDGKTSTQIVTQQVIAQGPVASQEVIKEFGTNGGGFFNANSAHPFENPTPLSNFFEMVLIFAIPSGLTYTLGRMTGSQRHGWAVWAAMAFLFLAGVTTAYWAEARGNPLLAGTDQRASALQSGGNMEGKEVRFGIANSTLFATVTTDASCGAVNGMHDSYTPLGGMVPLINIMLGEVVFGGVGAGLYGIFVFVMLAVFIAGLMVGRTPEYLGKKIEVLRRQDGHARRSHSHVHDSGLFRRRGGQAVRHRGHHKSRAARVIADSLCIRFVDRQQWLGVRRDQREHDLVQHDDGGCSTARSVLHDHSGAGHCRKPRQEEDCSRIGRNVSGHRRLFAGLLVSTILIVGALTFFPALSLGPILEHLLMNAGKAF